MRNLILTIVLVALLSTPKSNAQEFAKGADVTWLPQMEATGYQFYDTDGTKKDALQLLKDKGMNTVRLRVFVNPSDDPQSGHCSKEETVAFALRAQKMGFRIMINFHYSDSWADPGKQNKPAAWKDLQFDKLADAVYDHTFDVMTALKKVNVKTEWVQVGNEIPGGMLWPDGSTDNWVQLGKLLNKGYDAVKAVDKSIKVIVHLDEGDNIQKYRTFYDNATAQKVKYDVIGLSYYPFWVKKDYTETIANLEFNLNDLVKRYNKEVMVVEVGGEDDKIENTKALLEATIKAVKNVPNNKGLGVLYWEPQGARSWSKYNLSAWLPDGKPSPALDAFKD
ncbi:MAG TPA: glycosyl hydrolase 53 family protein [Flavobacterium sp.]|uniref:glycoside hydrolase family 53 protein n=1 Tax=unclassified Flavobacterium TaxID=196869 RepID=UPI000E99633A|nr:MULTISPECIES: glycosyl hydrolase 53 family protein [unclassified Flavobacterium]HBI00798.1 arabinogalactan endo-1,4-beta-galactosidase [Flavobacterium sp.]HRE78486.1 glycosyl hydrolase 53 family protein [Flavobacterium sp.]